MYSGSVSGGRPIQPQIKEFVLHANNRFVEHRLHPLNVGSLTAIVMVGQAIDFGQNHSEPTVRLIAGTHDGEARV